MAQLHVLPVNRSEREKSAHADDRQPAGELVALPFIELDTVVKTMKMLRRFPDQRVLDNFNRSAPTKAHR